MKNETFQTWHPLPGKTNKAIDLKKYELVKQNILAILARGPLTHTQLMEALYQNIKDQFEGGVQWYGEVVKLDLEARHLVERTQTKPVLYRLKSLQLG